MANRASYIEFLIEHLSSLGEITTRRLFGGNSLYCNGTIFALVARDTLYLKADDDNRREFEARRLEPLHPFGDKSKSMGYYQAPAELFEDADALRHWGESAVAAGRRSAAKRSPRPKKRTR
jgi:DNA transformation protein and related proteins